MHTHTLKHSASIEPGYMMLALHSCSSCFVRSISPIRRERDTAELTMMRWAEILLADSSHPAQHTDNREEEPTHERSHAKCCHVRTAIGLEKKPFSITPFVRSVFVIEWILDVIQRECRMAELITLYVASNTKLSISLFSFIQFNLVNKIDFINRLWKIECW